MPERKHPRKPDWKFYKCDLCFETFWGPRTDSDSHTCSACYSPRQFIEGRPAEGRSDRQYHGGQFNKGEW